MTMTLVLRGGKVLRAMSPMTIPASVPACPCGEETNERCGCGATMCADCKATGKCFAAQCDRMAGND